MSCSSKELGTFDTIDYSNVIFETGDTRSDDGTFHIKIQTDEQYLVDLLLKAEDKPPIFCRLYTQKHGNNSFFARFRVDKDMKNNLFILSLDLIPIN